MNKNPATEFAALKVTDGALPVLNATNKVGNHKMEGLSIAYELIGFRFQVYIFFKKSL